MTDAPTSDALIAAELARLRAVNRGLLEACKRHLREFDAAHSRGTAHPHISDEGLATRMIRAAVANAERIDT